MKLSRALAILSAIIAIVVTNVIVGKNNVSSIKLPNENTETMSVVYFDHFYGSQRDVELKQVTTQPEWSDPTVITIVKKYSDNYDTLVAVTVLYQSAYENTRNMPLGDYEIVEYWQVQLPTRNTEVTSGEEIAKEIAKSFSSKTFVARYYAYGVGYGIGYEE